MGKGIGLLTLCLAFAWVGGVLLADEYLPPGGGYLYSYEANAGQDVPGTGGAGAFDALDGTWGHDNGSDNYDGDTIGAGDPGGMIGIDGYLRIQDTGDPRDYALPDNSNRKVYFGHNLTANGAAEAFLNAGATLHFRARIPTQPPIDDLRPDGGSGVVAYPAGGDGYLIHDGGKGNVTLHQNNAGAGGTISFSLTTLGATDTGGLAQGVLTNNLNGTAISGTVDSGEAGTPNVLTLDATQWHEFWITVAAGGAGTHQVTVYADGSATPAATFDVTAGNGSDFAFSYLAMGTGSTAQSGALDVDFVRVAAGVQAPVPTPEPPAVPTLSGLGMGILALLLAAGFVAALARRRPAIAH